MGWGAQCRAHKHAHKSQVTQQGSVLELALELGVEIRRSQEQQSTPADRYEKRRTKIDKLKKAITSLYGEFGYFVTKANYSLEGIPDSRMYGDLIWLCHEGVVISPDYFTPADKNILGMHGYRPIDTQHFGFCLIADKEIDKQKINEPVPLTAVYKELIKYFQ